MRAISSGSTKTGNSLSPFDVSGTHYNATMSSKKIYIIRRLPTWLIFMMLAVVLSSCENDIRLFNPDQEKAYVVFGLLNSTDPLQQIKIRLTSVTDAAITGLPVDSSEFSAPPGLQVSVQEWFRDQYAVYPFVPVTFSKDPGLFENIRNDVFEASFYPNPDMAYKLIITNPENGDLITSKILPVPAPKLGAPNWPWIRYNFSLDGDPFNIRFREVPRAHVYLVQFVIRYIEVYTNGDTIYQEAAFMHHPRYSSDPPEYSPRHENLGNEHNQHMTKRFTYNVFDEKIPDREGVSYRQLICFEVDVWGGDQNLRNYTELGIRFTDNRKQVFTNVVNGIGFFGACSHAGCTGILPDRDFMDSLPLYPRTSRLKFRSELFRPALNQEGGRQFKEWPLINIPANER